MFAETVRPVTCQPVTLKIQMSSSSLAVKELEKQKSDLTDSRTGMGLWGKLRDGLWRTESFFIAFIMCVANRKRLLINKKRYEGAKEGIKNNKGRLLKSTC